MDDCRNCVEPSVAVLRGNGGADLFVFFEYPAQLRALLGARCRRPRRGCDVASLPLRDRDELSYHADVFYRSLLNAYEENGFASCRGGSLGAWHTAYHKSYRCTRAAALQWRHARRGDGRIVNQFPHGRALSLKDQLALRLAAMARLRGGAAQFDRVCPETYVLPAQLAAFRRRIEGVGDSDAAALWISKPYSRSKGKGITLWRGQAQLDELCAKVECSAQEKSVGAACADAVSVADAAAPRGRQAYVAMQIKKMQLDQAFTPELVVQHYVARPYLLDGLKFDLRLYVALTSVDFISLYIFPEGLARFCTSPYEAARDDMDNHFAHLTNSSLNVQSAQYALNTGVSAGEMATGSKRSFSSVLAALAAEGVDIELLWAEIGEVVKKAFVAFEVGLTAESRRMGCAEQRGFMLFGADIILEAREKGTPRPVLLEINAMPQIDAARPIDKLIKGTMLCDLLHLAGHRLPAPLVARFNERAALSPAERTAYDDEASAIASSPVAEVPTEPLGLPPPPRKPTASMPMPMPLAMPMPSLPMPSADTGRAAEESVPPTERSHRRLLAALTAVELEEHEAGLAAAEEVAGASLDAKRRCDCAAFVERLKEDHRRIGHWHRIFPVPSTTRIDAELFSTVAARRRYTALADAFEEAMVSDVDLAALHTIGDSLGSILDFEE